MKLLINTTANTIILEDLNGLTIEPGDSVNGESFGADALRLSADVLYHVTTGQLDVSDGFTTYHKLQAIDFLRGTPTQVGRDGKPILTASDRPQFTVWNTTNCGDNLVLGTRGGGETMDFEVAPGTSQSKDFQFIENVYLKEGTAWFSSPHKDCALSILIVCPAGIPFPAAPAYNGNFDLVDNTWVPNATNTGAYFILATETVLHRFINHLWLTPWEHMVNIKAPECDVLPSPYILRMVLTNTDTTGTLEARVNIMGYRPRTI
jgi:hypothetical protein